MLFSNAEVAAFVRSHFTAAWESVRPVPTVEIDFGNGKKLKRTVNGNIATYICDPTGRVVDVIPGLNTPEAYLRDLRYALNLYRASLAAFDKTVIEYHQENRTTPTVYEWVRNDMAKSMSERLMRMSLDKRAELAERKGLDGIRIARGPEARRQDAGKFLIESPVKKLTFEEEVVLAADTETQPEGTEADHPPDPGGEDREALRHHEADLQGGAALRPGRSLPRPDLQRLQRRRL